MNWRMRIAAVTAFVACFFSFASQAQTLYSATGSNGVAGQLFTVNPATAAATLVGPVLVGVTPICITGLAVRPTTGVLYGIVSNNCANFPANLVTINTTTGAAAVIGPLGAPGSDLAFSNAGTLYVWQQGGSTLATVNIATGAATTLGASGLAGTTGGGLAINAGGTAFVSVTGAGVAGTLDTVNIATGAGTTGPVMTGQPQPASMNAMSFNSAGTLFAVNSNNGGVATTNLVTINTATGAVTNIGGLPNDTDALAFAVPAAGPIGAAPPTPTASQWTLILMALSLGVVGAFALRRRS